jgi:hypothetical protein
MASTRRRNRLETGQREYNANVPGRVKHGSSPVNEVEPTGGGGLGTGEITELKKNAGHTAAGFRRCCPRSTGESETYPLPPVHTLVTINGCSAMGTHREHALSVGRDEMMVGEDKKSAGVSPG